MLVSISLLAMISVMLLLTVARMLKVTLNDTAMRGDCPA
jgi:hypothetical protein